MATATLSALAAPGRAGVIQFDAQAGTLRINGQPAVAVHGVPVTYAGLEPGDSVGRFYIHGDLRLLAGSAGEGGSSDVLIVASAAGAVTPVAAHLVVGNDFIAEPGTRVVAAAEPFLGGLVPAGAGRSLVVNSMQSGTVGGAGGGRAQPAAQGSLGLSGNPVNFVSTGFGTLIVPGGLGGAAATGAARGGGGGYGVTSTGSALGGYGGAGHSQAGANGTVPQGTSAFAELRGVYNTAAPAGAGLPGAGGAGGLGGADGSVGAGGEYGHASVFQNSGGDGGLGGHALAGTPGGAGSAGGLALADGISRGSWNC